MDVITLIVIGIAVVLFYVFIGSGLFQIGSGQVGILSRKIYGKKMPQGQIVAREGEIGVQAKTLLPGLYFRFFLFWGKNRPPITNIDEGHVGVVESIDGEPIPLGRLLGDAVDCRGFQDAEAFYRNHGKKGPQVGILQPGQHRVNTYAFVVKPEIATVIPAGKVGLVTALDGLPLPPKRNVAPRPTNPDHNFFQNGQAFLDNSGYRGPQLDVLQPGIYYINPKLFDVAISDQYEVPPGYVAILRSNVGEELEPDKAKALDEVTSGKALPSDDESIHEAEVLLTTDKNTRGIYTEPIAPGRYPLNTLAYTAYPVITSAVMVDWASSDSPDAAKMSRPSAAPASDAQKYPYLTANSAQGEAFFKFGQLRVTTKDGFELGVDVRMVIRIEPKNAAFVIARFGTVFNLIQQIVHPLIDASFRNNAGVRNALDFISEREGLQEEALAKAKNVFEKYRVEAQNLLISYIDMPKELRDTQTKKMIAVQQQTQFSQEALAQEKNIDLQEKSARAQKQPEVVQSILDIQINENKAIAQVKQAEGIKESTKIIADGTAYQTRKTGEAQADAYNAQAVVLGPDKVALVKVVDELSSKGIRITPDILVTGGKDGDQTSQLFGMYLTTLLQSNKGQTPDLKYVPKSSEEFVSELSSKKPVQPTSSMTAAAAALSAQPAQQKKSNGSI